jgi:hypothetical protein
MSSADPVTTLLKTIPALELLRFASMPEAERLSGLSEDSLRRHHRDKIKKLSPRRDGIRVIDALMLRESTEAA